MSYEVTGKLHFIGDTEQKTDKFSAREFVIEIQGGQYPQLIKFQLVQDRCELVDGASEGDTVTVHFDLRGREWNGKYFTNLNAWKVDIEEGQTAENKQEPVTTSQADKPPVEITEDTPLGSVADEDLPF